MKKIKGVLFDMDGLLLDTESVYCRTNIELSEKWGLEGYDAAHYLSELGKGEEQVYHSYFEDFPNTPAENVEGFFKETRASIAREFAEIGVPAKKGAVELLTYLNEENIPCLIVSSNNRKPIDDLLRNGNLTHFFTDVISADDVTHAKPHPEIVEKAIERLGILPEEGLMLEDSLNGIRASHAAGVPVMMVPDLMQPEAEAKEKAIAIYPSLLEVLDAIKAQQ